MNILIIIVLSVSFFDACKAMQEDTLDETKYRVVPYTSGGPERSLELTKSDFAILEKHSTPIKKQMKAFESLDVQGLTLHLPGITSDGWRELFPLIKALDQGTSPDTLQLAIKAHSSREIIRVISNASYLGIESLLNCSIKSLIGKMMTCKSITKSFINQNQSEPYQSEPYTDMVALPSPIKRQISKALLTELDHDQAIEKFMAQFITYRGLGSSLNSNVMDYTYNNLGCADSSLSYQLPPENPDECVAVTQGSKATVVNLRTLQEIHLHIDDDAFLLNRVIWSFNGFFLVGLCENNRMYIWDIRSKECIFKDSHPTSIGYVAVSADGTLLAKVVDSDKVFVINIKNNKLVRVFQSHAMITCLDIRSDGQLVVCDRGNQTHIMSANGFIYRSEETSNPIECICYDGNGIVGKDSAGKLHFWDVPESLTFSQKFDYYDLDQALLLYSLYHNQSVDQIDWANNEFLISTFNLLPMKIKKDLMDKRKVTS